MFAAGLPIQAIIQNTLTRAKDLLQQEFQRQDIELNEKNMQSHERYKTCEISLKFYEMQFAFVDRVIRDTIPVAMQDELYATMLSGVRDSLVNSIDDEIDAREYFYDEQSKQIVKLTEANLQYYKNHRIQKIDEILNQPACTQNPITKGQSIEETRQQLEAKVEELNLAIETIFEEKNALNMKIQLNSLQFEKKQGEIEEERRKQHERVQGSFPYHCGQGHLQVIKENLDKLNKKEKRKLICTQGEDGEFPLHLA